MLRTVFQPKIHCMVICEGQGMIESLGSAKGQDEVRRRHGLLTW
jgi:hypothetical protein